MTRALAVAAALSAALAGRTAAQERPVAAGAEVVAVPVFVRDVGPGEAGRVLRRSLLGRRVVLRAAERLVLPRDSVVATGVVVFGGGSVAVGSDVVGDVIVVGGDLFLHPGGRIRGDAVAIGGAVYGSTLAVVEGRSLSFRDLTFDAVTLGEGVALDYRSLIPEQRVPLVTLPGVYGVRLPSLTGGVGLAYDRVNGVTLPIGPRINLDSGRVFVDPLVIYRSDLGALDPFVDGGLTIGRRDSVSVSAGRGTFTNDAWIRSDFWNSVLTLGTGRDTRNYFRADRAEARVHRRWEGAYGVLVAFAGGRAEDAWSVGPFGGSAGASPVTSGPWSVLAREDALEGMLRPNPVVDDGRMVSGLAGASLAWENADEFAVDAWLLVEQAFDAPESFGAFTQVTLDADVRFPTFRRQSFRFQAHALFTGPDVAPRQRWSYLGGSGTLPTFDLLEFGGDELLFLESRYNIPIEQVRLPFFGTPVLTLRHMLGAAGPGRLPDFEQNLGVRLSLFLLRLDYTIDPRTRETEFGAGIALTR